MSLLNDALRDLEKREGTDDGNGASIPAGLSTTAYRTPQHWRWVLGVLALLLAVAVGLGFWWFSGTDSAPAGEGPMPAMDPAPVPVIRPATPEPSAESPENTGTVERPDAGSDSTTDSETETSSVEPVAGPDTDSESSGSVEEPEVVETKDPPEATPSKQPDEPEPEAASAEQADTEEETTAVREQTPAEQDRQLARELEELLADGRRGEAAERLRQRVMLDSDAPRSRAVMASHALAGDDPRGAQQWLPAEAVAMYPELRLLRARVALAREGRASALEWLESDPPGAAKLPAYHTMMAALYQQRGDHEAAASQWAALIETDDDNARWWAGLGIAMEAQGKDEQARTAWSRALSLPDLAPQLRRYIEQRLAAEQG
ncbi:MAG: hypothetical protein ACQERE_00630 [Pseudomonadota bacterium]